MFAGYIKDLTACPHREHRHRPVGSPLLGSPNVLNRGVRGITTHSSQGNRSCPGTHSSAIEPYRIIDSRVAVSIVGYSCGSMIEPRSLHVTASARKWRNGCSPRPSTSGHAGMAAGIEQTTSPLPACDATRNGIAAKLFRSQDRSSTSYQREYAKENGTIARCLTPGCFTVVDRASNHDECA